MTMRTSSELSKLPLVASEVYIKYGKLAHNRNVNAPHSSGRENAQAASAGICIPLRQGRALSWTAGLRRGAFSALLKYLVIRLVAICGLLAVSGCSQTLPLRKQVQILESGIEVHNATRVYWISPDQLLFSALTDEYVMEGKFRKRISRLTTWNTRTNEIKQFGKVDGGLCYDQGNIAYWETDNIARRQWITTGTFGGVMTREEGVLRYDEFMSCLPFQKLPKPPPRPIEHDFVRLRPEHGFIDLGPRTDWTKNTSVSLYRPGSSEPIVLPFKRREFVHGTIKYFRFKGAYFVSSLYFDPALGYQTSPWPSGVARPVWWLYPDGKAERIVVSPTAWMRERFVPTKRGLLAISNAFFSITGEPPFDGAYLLDGKREHRLLRGLFAASDVSSDGCRFAVRRQPQPGVRRPDFWTTTMLSLCEGER